MSSCCACCCFYPKYKRKVDNIYPRQNDAPLVKNEVDKLLYYATVHPEKLSKIGEYLYQNLKWALNNGYKYATYIENTIEALEKILLAITAQNLNYYAPTYLKVIQKLLEQGYGLRTRSVSQNGITNTSSYGTLSTINNESLRYQKKAAGLFQKFCEKESSNLSNYNLNFDQFVCQFSSLCYNSNKDEAIRAEIRSSGLQCLATMVNRLVPEDNLRAGYIWDNVDKIVAGILFIIHERYLARYKTINSFDQSDYDYHEDEQELTEYIYGDLYMSTRLRQSMDKVDSEPGLRVQFNRDSECADEENVVISLNENKLNKEKPDAEHEAKILLKNLCTKADYTTISKIVVPILDFLDDNGQNGWDLTKFVRCIFLIVIYNVRQQHAFVVRELLKHLDSHRNSRAPLKCKIIRTIILCTKISAMQSVGTTGQIIDIFNNLLKHMNISVEKSYNLTSTQKTDNLSDENKLQKEITSAMRQFTENMPDYAKNDILVFFARQINSQQFSYFELSGNTQTDKNELELLNSRKRAKYYECLYEICTRYKPVQLFGAFGSQQFLEDSLKLILVSDYASRKKANEILQLLIDKYHLLDRIHALKPGTYRVPVLKQKFKSATSLNDSKLSLNKHEQKTSISRNQTFLSQLSLDENRTKFRSTREDSMFMRKHGRTILAHFNEYLFIANNRRENYESAYLTLSLIIIGFWNDNEFLAEFLRFGLYVQDLALLNHDSNTFTFGLQCSVHKFLCAYFLLVAKSSQIADLYNYVSEICDMRRRKDLYKFVYPEYILLDSASDSGIQSQVSSFSEIESELRRDMAESAKDYRAYVDALSRHSDNEIDWCVKLPAWMFDKKRIEQILIKNNFNKNLSITSAEYTLSFSCVESAMRYRNPYSNESEMTGEEGFNRGHNRGFSAISQNNQTPRRSIDMDSVDDDTSYDSTSQISIDQGFELDPNLKENIKFYIDDNQNTVTSINGIKNNKFVDLTSFDTIRRMLFNSGSNVNASNLSNSGLGVGSSTVGPASSIVPVNTPAISINVSAEDQNEKNQKIIRDFYQMPFDELKQNLLRTNQNLMSNEKYQQVFDFISRDYADPNKSNVSVSSMSTNASVQSHLNKDNLNQSKSVALGDIDFPKLFIN